MKEKSPQTVTITEIEKVINKLNKDKAPGLTTIPVSYYDWGDKPMYRILDRWFQQMRKYQYVPWNLKIDIKTPMPKYEVGAQNTTKQEPKKLSTNSTTE